VAATRAALARTYESQGQISAAEFWRATADLVARKDWKRPSAVKPIWLCASADPEESSEIGAVEALLREGQWKSALARASDALEARSRRIRKPVVDRAETYSCRVAAVWAQTVLVNAYVDPGSVTWEQREMAVRTLVVAVEDLNISEPSIAFGCLADYFLATKDLPSSYGVLAAAREDINALPDSIRRRADLARIEERMDPFRRELKLKQ
jgi:hypothetical protein